MTGSARTSQRPPPLLGIRDERRELLPELPGRKSGQMGALHHRERGKICHQQRSISSRSRSIIIIIIVIIVTIIIMTIITILVIITITTTIIIIIILLVDNGATIQLTGSA